MKMQLFSIAFIVSAGLTSVQPNNEMDTEPNAIQENFHNFFDSIRKNDAKKTENYRSFLKQDAVRERYAFDAVKDEFRRNAHKQRNPNHQSGDIVEKATAFKREANEMKDEPTGHIEYEYQISVIDQITAASYWDTYVHKCKRKPEYVCDLPATRRWELCREAWKLDYFRDHGYQLVTNSTVSAKIVYRILYYNDEATCCKDQRWELIAGGFECPAKPPYYLRQGEEDETIIVNVVEFDEKRYKEPKGPCEEHAARKTKVTHPTRVTVCESGKAPSLSPKQMRQREKLLEEANKRDHRTIGQNQELFFFDDHSPGSCYFLPRGALIYNTLVNYIQILYHQRGYLVVKTPEVYHTSLWQTSGHWDHYAENMFLSDKADFSLKPMNCPGHCIIFGNRNRSWRELPIRLADFGVLHRNELSGTLTGLTRVRRFQQDDAHIFCETKQIQQEVTSVLDFLQEVYTTLGFTFRCNLATRPAKFMGDPALWDDAERQLEQSLNAFGTEWKTNIGDGAFYGPKIDVTVQDALNHSHQCATIQLDFQLPIRFNLTYADESNSVSRPVIIHRAILGSLERMIGILAESYAGKWPFWLSPRQAVVVPVAKPFNEYAVAVRNRITGAGFQCDADTLTTDTLKKKIRNAQTEQYNFILVVGQKEVDSDGVGVRTRDMTDHGLFKVEEVIARFEKLRRNRSLKSEKEFQTLMFQTNVTNAKRMIFCRSGNTSPLSPKRMTQPEKLLGEADKRDHRRIGKDQELFFFDGHSSPGSTFFMPRGALIYNTLVNYMRTLYLQRDYQEVITPEIYDPSLWQKSGHWDHCAENRFLFRSNKSDFLLKPMNSPGHCTIFRNRKRSWRELPMRLADFGVLHKNESLSGTLTDLSRVRRFQQDDAHIFCETKQIQQEVTSILDFLQEVYSTLGFTFRCNLATRPAKFMGDPTLWDDAERHMEQSLNAFGAEWKTNIGDGAFYGPKIDVTVQDALNHSHQCATIQLDFQSPLRFNLTYADRENNSVSRPVIIHRVILGSLERMIGILAESYAGKWPFWLSPRQAVVIPTAPQFNDYATAVRNRIIEAGFECDADTVTGGELNKMIRNAQMEQYNFILVVGEKEKNSDSVDVRTRDVTVHGVFKVEEVIARFEKLKRNKSLNSEEEF